MKLIVILRLVFSAQGLGAEEVMDLWEGRPPYSKANTLEEFVKESWGVPCVQNVTKPNLTIFPAQGQNSGRAMISRWIGQFGDRLQAAMFAAPTADLDAVPHQPAIATPQRHLHPHPGSEAVAQPIGHEIVKRPSRFACKHNRGEQLVVVIVFFPGGSRVGEQIALDRCHAVCSDWGEMLPMSGANYRRPMRSVLSVPFGEAYLSIVGHVSTIR